MFPLSFREERKEGGREGGGERYTETLMWGCLLYPPHEGMEPTTQACALTENRTCKLLVHRLTLQPPEPRGQGWFQFLNVHIPLNGYLHPAHRHEQIHTQKTSLNCSVPYRIQNLRDGGCPLGPPHKKRCHCQAAPVWTMGLQFGWQEQWLAGFPWGDPAAGPKPDPEFNVIRCYLVLWMTELRTLLFCPSSLSFSFCPSFPQRTCSKHLLLYLLHTGKEVGGRNQRGKNVMIAVLATRELTTK